MKTFYIGFTLVLIGALSRAVAQQAAQPVTPPALPVPPPPPPPHWETTAGVGLTLTKGNSDTLLFTGKILTSKKAVAYEIDAGLDGAYGEDHNQKNTESLHGFGQYNRIFAKNWYGYFRIDGLHDAIADLEYRFTFSPGIGYYFIKNDQNRLSAEIGPGYIYEKQGSDTDGYFTARAAERFEHKFSEKAKLWQSIEFLPEVNYIKNYIINGEVGVDTPLAGNLTLRTYLQDTYDNVPAPGRKKNDLKLVTGLAYKF